MTTDNTTDNRTFDKKVYAGMPFRYKITKARYWDKTVAKSVTANTVDYVALEPYDGVTITQDGTALSVSAGILPDGGAYGGYRGVAAPAGKRYFLRNANTVYDNFSRRGSPDIGEDGVLRNITSGNNIYTAFYNQSYPWEITVKIHTPETFADQSYIFGNYSTNRATPQLCTDAAGHLMLYLASSTSAWDIADGAVSEQALAADTDYVIKAGWDGAAYTVTANGEEFIRVVSAAVQYSTTAAQLCFGFDSGNNAWTGTIDLHNSLITVDGKAYWKAYTVYSEILPGALDGDTGALADWNCFCDAEAETTAFDTAAAVDGKVWIGHKVIESHVTNPWPIVHFSVEGGVTFRGDTAAFADGMWLVADKTLPVTEFFFGDVEFIAKITPKTPSGYNTVFRNAETNAFFGLYGAAWCIYDGSRKTGGTATAGTTYWVRAQMIYDAEKGAYASTLYVLEDNGAYTADTLPEAAAWTQAVQTETDVFKSGEPFWLSNDGTSSFNGDMDLAQAVLRTKTSGGTGGWTDYWKPLEEQRTITA